MLSHQLFPEASFWDEVRNSKINLSAWDKQMSYTNQCKRLCSENNKIPIIHSDRKIVRIATYNVHFWADPFFEFQTTHISKRMQNICQTLNISPESRITPVFDVIDNMNADILILEEVSSQKNSGTHVLSELDDFKKILSALGYIYGLEQDVPYNELKFFGDTLQGTDEDKKYSYRGPFGNWIVSKLPFAHEPTVTHYQAQHRYVNETRCFVHCKILLPSSDEESSNSSSSSGDQKDRNILSVYGTHLDVFDEHENIRLAQVTELLEVVSADSSQNIIVAGDLNSVRHDDYTREQFNLLIHENMKRNCPTPTKALDYFKTHGFTDCFTKNEQKTPQFTAWAGTTIDFIMLNSAFNLEIDGCYVYYDAASDHLPVLMDVKF